MKKYSLVPVLMIAFLMTSTGVFSAEKKAEPVSEITQTVFLEDDVALETEKIYEEEDIVALKYTLKTFSDGHNTYVNDKIQFTLTDVDNVMLDKIYYRINDGEEKLYDGPFTLTEEGTQVIYYYSVDKMGNVESVKNFNVILDKTAPEVVVTIRAPFFRVGDQVYASDKFKYDYSIASKDNIAGVASVAYADKDGEYVEYVRPFSINSNLEKINVLAEDRVGNFTKSYMIKIIDEDGNVISESYDLDVLIDNTAPVVSITPDKKFFMKDSAKIASKDYKYSLTATDAESGVKAIFYRINSKSEFVPYTGELQFNENGWHKIEAIAKDNVGNMSKTEVLDVYVDLIPAQTTINIIR